MLNKDPRAAAIAEFDKEIEALTQGITLLVNTDLNGMTEAEKMYHNDELLKSRALLRKILQEKLEIVGTFN